MHLKCLMLVCLQLLTPKMTNLAYFSQFTEKHFVVKQT